MLPTFPAAGLAVVRVAHDLRQRGVAPRPVHRRPALAGGGLSRCGGSLVRLPRPRDDGRERLLAGRELRLVSARGRQGLVRSATGGGRHDGGRRSRGVWPEQRREVPGRLPTGLRLVPWPEQLAPAPGRRPVWRLL